MSSGDTGSLTKFILGVGVGVALVSAYVRFGYKPPAVLQIADTVTSEAAVAAAELSLYSPDADPDARRRALAVVLGKKPELVVQVNEELNDRILADVLRRRAMRRATQLRLQSAGYEKALAQPALRERLETRYGATEPAALKRRMLATAIRKDKFLTWYLRNYTAERSDENFANVVLQSDQTQLQPERIGNRAATPGVRR